MENKKTPTNYNENNPLNNNLIKDAELSFIIKKTEKVATAIYMISNFFNVDEPLKWELRRNVTKLLKNLMSFNDSSLSNKEIIVSRVSSDFVELNTMFNLAYNAGFISQMNYEIVISEIQNVSQMVVSYSDRQASLNKTLFRQDYFEVKKDINANVGGQHVPRESNFIKDTQKDIKDRVSFKGQKSDLDSFFKKMNMSQESDVQKDLSSQNPQPSQNSERENRILQKIKMSGPVTIKEIAEDFKDVSEKTIQRELQKMYDRGQIKKEGERRWTKYFI